MKSAARQLSVTREPADRGTEQCACGYVAWVMRSDIDARERGEQGGEIEAGPQTGNAGGEINGAREC